MGKHLDKEIIATELLPQLWRMSFGPLLNVDQVCYLSILALCKRVSSLCLVVEVFLISIYFIIQFKKFMRTIRELSTRVEEQHTKHLQQVKSLDDQTRSLTIDNASVASSNMVSSDGGISDFERLVQGGGVNAFADTGDDPFGAMVGSSVAVPGHTHTGILEDSFGAIQSVSKQLQQYQSRPSSPLSGAVLGNSPVSSTTKPALSASTYQQPVPTPTLLTSRYQHPPSASPILPSIPLVQSNSSTSSSLSPNTWSKPIVPAAVSMVPLQPPISSSTLTSLQPPMNNHGFASVPPTSLNPPGYQRSQASSHIPAAAPNFDALKSYTDSFSNLGSGGMGDSRGVMQPNSNLGSMGVLQPTVYSGGDGRVNNSGIKTKKEDLDLFDPFSAS